MRKKYFRSIKSSVIIGGLVYSSISVAQVNLNNLPNLGDVHGNFQATAQYYIPDSTIGAPDVPEKMLMNGFANIIYTKGKFTAGLRYESYLNGLQGFDARYQGSGIQYRFASYKSDALEVTVGNFYQQFGNGLVLRSYEERGLGFDNALDGIRLKYEVVKGLYLTGLTGKQRSFMTQGPGIIRGFDGEMQLNETFKKLSEKKLRLTLGGSFVSRYQKDEDPALNLPQNVGASAGRFELNYLDFHLNGEYASKINDPNAANGKIYRPGDAELLLASYATKGLAISASASRADNMNFRSDRDASLNNLLLNYTPALNKNHTYSLLTFYPNASQPNGELQFSGEVNWKVIKKPTYKLDVTFNYSGSNDLDTTHLNVATDSTLQGYKTNSFGMGKNVIFRDFYVEINQKFGKKIKTSLMYSYQVYNKSIIQKAGFPIIYSHIVVADISYRLKGESTVRVELQNLYTEGDHQSWAQGMVEYTVNSNWFVAVLDQYNYGNEVVEHRYHYPNATVGFNKNANRITLSYGKQRAGIFCVGGICRLVPASNGITLTVTSSF
ncbi:MAG: DUF6029 family protein [Bacteroidetes bacterium]|nr:DUF6029 family protein [Bacteroidota bacterium]